MKGKVVVGLSGGVDSSVAALLLKKAGYTVEGLFMKNWEEEDDDHHCAAAEDLQDARRVCQQLEIPFHTVNFSTEYWDRVFTTLLEGLQAGQTPNPDIFCNREIKFGLFWTFAQKILGATWMSTGHYAQRKEGRLYRSADRRKDQTYFLYTLTQDQLKNTLFPLGEMQKSEVRALAQQNGLVTAQKKDSTGICFIGQRPFGSFMARYLTSTPGPIFCTDGRQVGTHQGLFRYTLGQRKGLGIGGRGAPWYVVEKQMEHNTLVVTQQPDDPRLYSDTFTLETLHWISSKPSSPCRCSVKNRHMQQDQSCQLFWTQDGAAYVRYDTPQRALTPGQAAVFYQGEEVLGGGTIMQVGQVPLL